VNDTVLYTTVGAILSAILGFLGAAYQVKAKARVDISQSITAGFKELTDQLQEDNASQREQIRALQTQVDLYRKSIETLFNEAEGVRVEMRLWKHRASELTRMLKDHGVDIPTLE
jgi:hypothetical protein